MVDDEGPEDVALPALLRASRGAYGHAVRQRLHRGGFDDLPRNGPFVLGGMANRGGNADELVRQLGTSRQGASQLLDTLVIRGYLDRAPDPADTRRTVLSLTARGRAAAEAVRQGVTEVDEELEALITPDELAGLTAGLIALCDIRDRYEEAHEAGAEYPLRPPTA